MTTPPSPEHPIAPVTPAVDSAEARIAFIFRTTQRQGRIHPLLHLMQQHRAARAKTEGETT